MAVRRTRLTSRGSNPESSLGPHERLALSAVVVLVALGAAACGSGAGGPLRWRGLDIVVPQGWVVHEEATTRFAITDAPLGTGDDPGPGSVGAFFTYEPNTTADSWRELAAQEGWTVTVDERIEVGGVPATRLVLDQPEADVPTREMVVLIPSRRIVVLFQPTPTVEQRDAAARFERFRDRFEMILDDLRLGAPDRDAHRRVGVNAGSVTASARR